MEKQNKRFLMVKNGYCYVDGVRIYDAVKFKAIFTPGVSTGRVLGDKTPNTRWDGTFEIKVELTRRRTTKWAKEIVKNYIASGKTPEFTFSGVLDDKDSDYYDSYGKDTVTVTGCVPTGDINVLELDTEGEYFDDVMNFNGKNIKMS